MPQLLRWLGDMRPQGHLVQPSSPLRGDNHRLDSEAAGGWGMA